MTTKHMELALTSTNVEPSNIRNGMISDGEGHRAVCFVIDQKTNELKIREMISQKTTEKYYGWNSGIQVIKPNDFVAICTWDLKGHRLQIYRNSSKGLTTVRNWGGKRKADILSKLPESIIEFLKPKGGGPSYLPSGYWRSKYDMIETMKQEQIEKFLSDYLEGEWLDYTVEEAGKAPLQHLITDWNSRHVKPLPTKITNHEEVWMADNSIESECLVHNSMVWVLIHANGKKEFIDPEATSGHRYLGSTRKVVETFTALPKGMPKTVVKAIQINLGAYEKDDRSYGARWYLYKR